MIGLGRRARGPNERRILFGICPLDPITFTMPVVLAVAAVPAGHVSARRSGEPCGNP
jgi:hypothetical protein